MHACPLALVNDLREAEGVNQSAVERVRKLLRLAESENVHEASLAEVQALSLMKRHRLSRDDVSEDVREIVDPKADSVREELARVLGRAFKCSAILGRKGALAFRGRPEAVAKATCAYRALSNEALLRCEMSRVGDPPPIARTAWRLCFWIGFTEAVAIRTAPPRVERRPPPAVPGRTPPPPAASDALQALEELAASLDVPDVLGVLERLRQRAHAAGFHLGAETSIPEPETIVPKLLTSRNP